MKKIGGLVKRSIFVLGLLFLVGGCSTTRVIVPVTNAAKIDLLGVKRVVIADVRGSDANKFESNLTEALFDSKRFDVLDRQHLLVKKLLLIIRFLPIFGLVLIIN